MDPVRQKIVMPLQKRQLFLGKHDPAVKFRAGENAAVAGKDMKSEKDHNRGEQQGTAHQNDQSSARGIHI